MDLGLAGARALVGGGSGGLGGAIAASLRAEGARSDSSAGRATATRRPRPARRRSPSPPTCRRPTARPPPSRRGRGLRRPRPARRQLRRSAAGAIRRARRGRLAEPPSTARCGARSGSCGRPCRICATGRDPAILVMLSSSAREPIPGLTTSNLIRPGLAGLIKSMVEEIVPVRINGLAPGRLATARIAQIDAARSPSTGMPGRGDPAPDDRPDPARALRRPAGARPGRRRSCSRRRPPTSPGRSSRSTAG